MLLNRYFKNKWQNDSNASQKNEPQKCVRLLSDFSSFFHQHHVQVPHFQDIPRVNLPTLQVSNVQNPYDIDLY